MPQNEDELELKVGDIIEVVGEVSSAFKLSVSRSLLRFECSS